MDSANFTELKTLARSLGIKIKQPTKAKIIAAIEADPEVLATAEEKLVLLQAKIQHSKSLARSPPPAPPAPVPDLGRVVTVLDPVSGTLLQGLDYEIVSSTQVLVDNKFLFTKTRGVWSSSLGLLIQTRGVDTF